MTQKSPGKKKQWFSAVIWEESKREVDNAYNRKPPHKIKWAKLNNAAPNSALSPRNLLNGVRQCLINL